MRFVYMVLITSSCSASSCSKNIDNTSDSMHILFANNMVVAHRGTWEKNNLPKNSIAALKQAIALNCTVSAFDMRMKVDDSR